MYISLSALLALLAIANLSVIYVNYKARRRHGLEHAARMRLCPCGHGRNFHHLTTLNCNQNNVREERIYVEGAFSHIAYVVEPCQCVAYPSLEQEILDWTPQLPSASPTPPVIP